MQKAIRLAIMVVGLLAAGHAMAQKRGGILTVPHIDTPPSPSIQEEGTALIVSNLRGNALDNPDRNFHDNCASGSPRPAGIIT